MPWRLLFRNNADLAPIPATRHPDLRRLGQTTKVAKSTLNDVRQKIADLRAKTAASAEQKKYDFDERIREIKALEQKQKDDERKRRQNEKREKQAKAEAELKGEVDEDVSVLLWCGAWLMVWLTAVRSCEQMMKAMGFGSFGGTR